MSRIESRKISSLVTSLLDWFAENARDLPWRRMRDPYAIWVSEVMLQQTQVKTVIPFWERWLRELPTIEAAANVNSEKLHKLWEGLGYYTRVRNLQKAAQVIVAQHDKKFPENFEDVLALPGIGRYTAGAICSIAFNQPVPIVDGNVIRVLTRIFGIAENPKAKETNARLWRLADELVAHAKTAADAKDKKTLRPLRPLREANACSFLNQSLMELGALVCTPRRPQCLICPVKKFCVAFQKNLTGELPNLGQRASATARSFFAFVIEHQGKFLVRQRPVGIVNAQLWEFPNVEVGEPHCEPLKIFSKLDGVRVTDTSCEKLLPLCTVKHSITRYRITLEAFFVSINKSPAKLGGFWKTPAQMEKLAFTSAHKKILNKITEA